MALCAQVQGQCHSISPLQTCAARRRFHSPSSVCVVVCVVLVMLCNLRCCSAADGGRRCRSASAINLKHPDLSGREERRISDFILCDVKLHCAAHVHCQCVQDEDGITLWTKPFKSFPSDAVLFSSTMTMTKTKTKLLR